MALNSGINDRHIRANPEGKMRTTLALDDELLSKAQEYTGIKEKSAVVRETLNALIEREAARRLTLLGGTQLRLKAPPRRRFKAR